MYLKARNSTRGKNILKIFSSPKEENATCVFYEEMKITIILSSILGALPISFDKTGKLIQSKILTIAK